MALLADSGPWLKNYLQRALSERPPEQTLHARYLQVISSVSPRRNVDVWDGRFTASAVLSPAAALDLDADNDELGVTTRNLVGYLIAPVSAVVLPDASVTPPRVLLVIKDLRVFSDQQPHRPPGRLQPVESDPDVLNALRANVGRTLATFATHSTFVHQASRPQAAMRDIDMADLAFLDDSASTPSAPPPNVLSQVGNFEPKYIEGTSSPTADGDLNGGNDGGARNEIPDMNARGTDGTGTGEQSGVQDPTTAQQNAGERSAPSTSGSKTQEKVGAEDHGKEGALAGDDREQDAQRSVADSEEEDFEISFSSRPLNATEDGEDHARAPALPQTQHFDVDDDDAESEEEGQGAHSPEGIPSPKQTVLQESGNENGDYGDSEDDNRDEDEQVAILASQKRIVNTNKDDPDDDSAEAPEDERSSPGAGTAAAPEDEARSIGPLTSSGEKGVPMGVRAKQVLKENGNRDDAQSPAEGSGVDGDIADDYEENEPSKPSQQLPKTRKHLAKDKAKVVRSEGKHSVTREVRDDDVEGSGPPKAGEDAAPVYEDKLASRAQDSDGGQDGKAGGHALSAKDVSMMDANASTDGQANGVDGMDEIRFEAPMGSDGDLLPNAGQGAKLNRIENAKTSAEVGNEASNVECAATQPKDGPKDARPSSNQATGNAARDDADSAVRLGTGGKDITEFARQEGEFVLCASAESVKTDLTDDNKMAELGRSLLKSLMSGKGDKRQRRASWTVDLEEGSRDLKMVFSRGNLSNQLPGGVVKADSARLNTPPRGLLKAGKGHTRTAMTDDPNTEKNMGGLAGKDAMATAKPEDSRAVEEPDPTAAAPEEPVATAPEEPMASEPEQSNAGEPEDPKVAEQNPQNDTSEVALDEAEPSSKAEDSEMVADDAEEKAVSLPEVDSVEKVVAGDVDVQPAPAPAAGDVDVPPAPVPPAGDVDVQPASAPAAGDLDVQPASAPAAGDVDVQPASAPAAGDLDVQPAPAPAVDDVGVQSAPVPAADDMDVQPTQVSPVDEDLDEIQPAANGIKRNGQALPADASPKKRKIEAEDDEDIVKRLRAALDKETEWVRQMKRTAVNNPAVFALFSDTMFSSGSDERKKRRRGVAKSFPPPTIPENSSVKFTDLPESAPM